MHEKVKQFLDAKKSAEMQFVEEEKWQTMIDLGLYEREYGPSSEFSEEYPNYEWDVQNQVPRYYRMVPVPITDEEYKEVLKYAYGTPQIKKTHPVAATFKTIAVVVFIVGFIAGICYGFSVDVVSSYYSSRADVEFSFGTAFAYWVESFISGMLFLGISSIIQLLNDIKNK